MRTLEEMQERLHTLHDEIDCLKYEAEKAAANERAKIVAWLLDEGKNVTPSQWFCALFAAGKAIEAGEHLK